MEKRTCQPNPRGGLTPVWGRGGGSWLITPGGVIGVSEEIDDAPLTLKEAQERIRLHNEGKAAQASNAQAQAEAACSNSSIDESSDASDVSSAEDSDKSAPRALSKAKKSSALATPRKSTSGLQQLGGNSSGKRGKDETPPVVDTISCEIRAKIKECADKLTEQHRQYASGMYDSARGRPMQTLNREWTDTINTAKKHLKIDGQFVEKRLLQESLQRLEAAMSLMKAVVKTSATYLETASCYDTLKLAGGTASEGCARALLDRNVDAKLATCDAGAAIALMAKEGGAPHMVHEVLPEGKIAQAQLAIATKVVLSVCKSKVAGSLETATAESSDAVVLLKHALGFESFPDELKTQVEIMFTCLHLSCSEEDAIRRAAEFTSGFPVPDARKPPDSPFAAFLLSKVGKQAVKNLAARAATAAKASAASLELKQMRESLAALSGKESITLRLLQLEAMPLLRKAKNCCKGADAKAVRETLETAIMLFTSFGTTSLQRMKDSAGFLFDSAPLFGVQPAPEEAFNACSVEVQAFGQLWQEIHADIAPFCFSVVPGAATETVTATVGAAVHTFVKYAKLGQDVASETEGGTANENSLQSLGTRLIEALQPEMWASIEVFVPAPS